MPNERGELTENEIAERLEWVDKWVTSAGTDVFSAAVDEGRMRRVVQLTLTGDFSVTRSVTIRKKEEDGTFNTMFSMIHVAPSDVRQLPLNRNIRQPAFMIAGGENLNLLVSGNSIQVTAEYWDDEIAT